MTQQSYYQLRSAFRMCLHLGRIGYGPLESAFVGVSNDVVNAVAYSMPLAVSYPGQLPKSNRYAGLAYRREHPICRERAA